MFFEVSIKNNFYTFIMCYEILLKLKTQFIFLAVFILKYWNNRWFDCTLKKKLDFQVINQIGI